MWTGFAFDVPDSDDVVSAYNVLISCVLEARTVIYLYCYLISSYVKARNEYHTYI